MHASRGATMSKPTIRKRWGVQHDFRERGAQKPEWDTLGVAWVIEWAAVPRCVDYWPANYATRQEARVAVQRLTVDAQRHSPHWRFRAVPLIISVREGR